ncbi:MAG: transposase [Rhodobacteraceae bacterium]|nr:transposase [Paracoccaceae bacterium]
MFLSHYEDIRAAGAKRITRRLTKAATGLRGLEALAEDAVQAAQAQTVTIPRSSGQRSSPISPARRWPPATGSRPPITRSGSGSPTTLIRPSSCRCMGATLTAEFIALVGRIDRFDSADALAAAAGLAPVLRQSGKTSFLRRAAGGDKARVFYQAAFTSLGRPDSRAFYDRKRAEGKRHHQAVIALARRRVNDPGQPFRENFKMAA